MPAVPILSLVKSFGQRKAGPGLKMNRLRPLFARSAPFCRSSDIRKQLQEKPIVSIA
jgi:hypothetical protein